MQKTGTSALAKILDEHPDLALSKKEVHFSTKFDQTSEITPLEQLKYASHWRLRDPMKQAYSHWNMNRQRRKVDLDFEEVIRQEREDEATGRPLRFTYLAQGRYDEIAEALKHEHDRVLHEVQTFHGVAPLPLPALVRHKRDYTFEPMSAKLEAELMAYFAPSRERFAALTGLDISDWTS